MLTNLGEKHARRAHTLVTSYLISTRFRDEKISLIIAISGILPDMDALLGMHRWVTHSIPPTLSIFLLIYLLMKDKWSDLALITSLYELPPDHGPLHWAYPHPLAFNSEGLLYKP